MSEKRWIIREMTPKSTKIPTSTFLSRVRFILPELDIHLRSIIPALFTEIKVTVDKVIVEVPLQVAPRIVVHLRGCYYIDVPLEVIGV